MWAVGALAWELLTGRPLFGDNFSDEDVVMALLGFKPLPFEADPSLWVLFTESQVSLLPSSVDRLLVLDARVLHSLQQFGMRSRGCHEQCDSQTYLCSSEMGMLLPLQAVWSLDHACMVLTMC